MTTLAFSFMRDLEDLDEDVPEEEKPYGKGEFHGIFDGIEFSENDLSDLKDVWSDYIPDAVQLYEESKNEDAKPMSDLSSQPEVRELLSKLKFLTQKEPEREDSVKGQSNILNENEYDLIEKCNGLVAKLDIEILNIHSFVRDIYSKKFPELESIVISPLEYIAVVQRIKNETDVTLIDLTDILPSTVTMAVTVAASMTTGQPLPASDLSKVLKAAEEAMHLADSRKTILGFLESRMDVLAPNVAAIIGSALAARLIIHAGGITALARMPSQNIMLIGSLSTSIKHNSYSNAIPASVTTSHSGTSGVKGVIYGCDIVQSTPPSVRNRAIKLVSGKVGLAARVDSYKESPDGSLGHSLREKILQSLLKAQEPPPAPLKKSLPVPDDVPKSRRGGKRYRKFKEKYEMSELRKHANRLIFGPEAEDEVGIEGELGLGMITKGLGYGKLKLQTKQEKYQVKRRKRQQRQLSSDTTNPSLSSGCTSGMSSSLVFTPLQGIELYNPDMLAKQQKRKHEKELDYFSPAMGFTKS